METIELNKDTLLSEYKKANACGKKYLIKLYGKETFIEPKKPLNLTDKLKTLSDVLKHRKTTLAKELPYKNPKTKRQKALNSSAIWMLIIETFNEGWIKTYPSNDDNYVPYGKFENGDFSYNYYFTWLTNSNVRAGSGFKNKETMLYCVTQFKKEWSNYLLGKA